MVKFTQGGYVPVALSLVVYALMYIWHRGVTAITHLIADNPTPIDAFMAKLAADRVARVPGTAVFLTRTQKDTPPVVAWYVHHSRALQERVIAINVTTQAIPWIDEQNRFSIAEIAPGFWRADARYGFMERPDLPRLLADFQSQGCTIDQPDVTFYVGFETIVARDDGSGLPHWLVTMFAAMQRNAAHVTDVFNLPRNRVVELGRQLAI
jgi:KUP system potassium uptake protein